MGRIYKIMDIGYQIIVKKSDFKEVEINDMSFMIFLVVCVLKLENLVDC